MGQRSHHLGDTGGHESGEVSSHLQTIHDSKTASQKAKTLCQEA